MPIRTWPPNVWRRLLLDGGLIAVLAVMSMLMGADPFLGTPAERKLIYVFGSADAWRWHIAVWWVFALPAVVAGFARHRWPLVAMVLVAVSVLLHDFDPVLAGLPLDLLALVALYTLAGTARSRPVSAATLAVLLAGLVLVNLLAPKNRDGGGPVLLPSLDRISVNELFQVGPSIVFPALLLGIAWAAGDNARTRRAHLATIEARAADLAREQDQRTALAVAAERGRITRELHDVVAHGLSVMVVQAQGAQAALHRHPERSQVALTNVITTGRASLAEMRRLLGLVRTEPAPQLAPQPSLALLPELIERVRASGTPVTFHVTGEPATLPTGVELSVYRIIQEALTNTLKHAAPGSRSSVTLDFTADRLCIRVHDTGSPDAPVIGGLFGNGLRGIAERVSALGGTLRAGPAGHGFEVCTVLPLETPA